MITNFIDVIVVVVSMTKTYYIIIQLIKMMMKNLTK